MGTLALIIIIFYVFWARSRITRIEQRLNELQNGSLPKSQTQQAVVGESVQQPQSDMSSSAEPIATGEGQAFPDMVPDSVSQKSNTFVDWVKDDFMMKLGALLLLIAFGWFVSYAFAENWIGPVGRITLGLLLGVILIALGTWRIRTHGHQGGIFAVLGSSAIILTIFAAREIYDFFTPVSALTLMFVTVAFVAYLSVVNRRETLAFVGLLIGSAAPLMVAAPSPSAAGLFSYLLVVALGTLWVVYLTGWTKLILTSLLITSFYSAPFILGSVNDKEVVAIFTFIFVSMYYAANVVSLVRRRLEGAVHFATHAITALLTAIFLVTWINAIVAPEWQSLLYVTWAMVFGVGTYVVYLYTANIPAFYIYGATSIGLIGVATAAELSGPALTIAYILEIFLLVVATAVITNWPRLVLRVSMLNFIPIILSIESFGSNSWNRGILHSDFVVMTMMATSLTLIGIYIRSLPVEEEADKNGKKVVLTSYAVSIGVYLTALVWLSTHALLASDLATTISLVIYTVAGVSLVVLSKVQNSPGFNLAGWVLVLGVVARLLLVEVWNMSLEGRIVTFLIIGVLLISTAFIRRLQKPVNEDVNQ